MCMCCAYVCVHVYLCTCVHTLVGYLQQVVFHLSSARKAMQRGFFMVNLLFCCALMLHQLISNKAEKLCCLSLAWVFAVSLFSCSQMAFAYVSAVGAATATALSLNALTKVWNLSLAVWKYNSGAIGCFHAQLVQRRTKTYVLVLL